MSKMPDIELIEDYFDRLWPICRSITGNGLRQSYKILQELIPLELEEIPSGTKCFDWTVPKEWNIKEAYIITPGGDKICDLAVCNLHVVNYSVPVNMEITYDELCAHLHYIKSFPEAIPYITSYYKESWGFCLSYNQFMTLPKEGVYKVVINSELKDGHLTYGHLLLKGKSEKEILLSSYLCHPSMANNELSGPLVLSFLYTLIKSLPERKYSYRFVLAPETIGVIAYLSKYGLDMKSRTEAGYVITCCGDSGDFVYKSTKSENLLTDRVARHILAKSNKSHKVISFSVGGSDERQYCSPGFNLPVGSITRSMYKKYKEYHTSLDNKNFISFKSLQETIEVYYSIIEAIELNAFYKGEILYCEPQLGRRNLYPHSCNPEDQVDQLHRILHLLSYADGELDLLNIAEKRNENILLYKDVVETLLSKKLIFKVYRQNQ